MFRTGHRIPCLLGLAGVLSGLVALDGPAQARAAETPFTVVASGLDNPRGLAFGPEGALYVAEAGRGGAGPCMDSAEGGQACYGASGAVTRLWHGMQQRIATGLPSLAGPDGGFATGPVDVSLQGRGNAHVVIGLGADPAVRDQLGTVGTGFGHLVQLPASGKWRPVADVSAYEAAANPDGGAIDSNPYAVLAEPGGHVVADAGGNDLLRVDASGRISTLAVFPDRSVNGPDGQPMPMQAVPNAITRGPDGAYYVGELTGFPFPVGGARVYHVVPGQAPTVYAEGFTNIIDLAFGPDGSLYVLEIVKDGLLSGSMTGALVRVAPDGTRTTVASEGLVAPGGLTVGPDGALYVSNYGVFAGQGQVIRLMP